MSRLHPFCPLVTELQKVIAKNLALTFGERLECVKSLKKMAHIKDIEKAGMDC